MDYLELAADNITERSEKGQIYFRIAELSFDQKDYDRSVKAYQQTIKNSQIKKRIQLSHLKIVQIYRLQNKFDLANDRDNYNILKNKRVKIKSMTKLSLLVMEGLHKIYSILALVGNSTLKDYLTNL